MSLLFDTAAVANACCCCINGPNCWKSICAVHGGFDISELLRNDEECRLVPFSTIFPFVDVNRLIVDGGRVCSCGVRSSSDISEYAGEDAVGGGGGGGGGVGIFDRFLLLFRSFFDLESR